MGEIKSTMDIVMERTKHLSMTEEEKEIQKKNTIQMTVKGFIQKYQDSILTKEQLGKQLDNLEKSENIKIKKIVMDDITERFALGHDNSMLLDLLNYLYSIDISGLESIFLEYRNTLTASYQDSISKGRKELSEKYAISGTAVIPNPSNNNAWKMEIQDIHHRFSENLNQEKVNL